MEKTIENGQVAIGDTVEFLFQGSWTAGSATNTGRVTRIRDNSIIVQTPNGANFHLVKEAVRRPGNGQP